MEAKNDEKGVGESKATRGALRSLQILHQSLTPLLGLELRNLGLEASLMSREIGILKRLIVTGR
jgi:hypothetical protein